MNDAQFFSQFASGISNLLKINQSGPSFVNFVFIFAISLFVIDVIFRLIHVNSK